MVNSNLTHTLIKHVTPATGLQTGATKNAPVLREKHWCLTTYGGGNNYKPKTTTSVHGNWKLNVTQEINILPRLCVSYDISATCPREWAKCITIN